MIDDIAAYMSHFSFNITWIYNIFLFMKVTTIGLNVFYHILDHSLIQEHL